MDDTFGFIIGFLSGMFIVTIIAVAFYVVPRDNAAHECARNANVYECEYIPWRYEPIGGNDG